MLVLSMIANQLVRGQIEVNGTVYENAQYYALPGVSVFGTSGAATVTDSLGHYRIRLPRGDSIYFSYLGKTTEKFPVGEIDLPFNMSLQVQVQTLPSVSVMPSIYRLDSLQNRIDYQKVFDYNKGTLQIVKTGEHGGGYSFGFDMATMLNAASNRRMLAFQQRLEDEEQDKYVDHRFSRALVKRITGLDSPILDSFMRVYRPTYDFIKTFSTDYEYYKYIQDRARSFVEMWKKGSENTSVKK
jgi:hypothetical protein